MTGLLNFCIVNNIIKLEILAECNFSEYLDEMDKFENVNFNVPIRMFITSGGSILNTVLQKQTIYLKDNSDVKFIFVNALDKFIISEKCMKKDLIKEYVIQINKDTLDFEITEFIHDSNFSTKSCRKYPINDNYINTLYLSEDEVLTLYDEFMNNLTKIIDDAPNEIKELYDLLISSVTINANIRKKGNC